MRVSVLVRVCHCACLSSCVIVCQCGSVSLPLLTLALGLPLTPSSHTLVLLLLLLLLLLVMVVRPAETIEALELYGLLSDKGRGCARDAGIAQRCRARAAQLRERERESNLIAIDRTAVLPQEAVVVVKRSKGCIDCSRCSVM